MPPPQAESEIRQRHGKELRGTQAQDSRDMLVVVVIHKGFPCRVGVVRFHGAPRTLITEQHGNIHINQDGRGIGQVEVGRLH